MREEKYRFLELMGNVDDEMIYQSCQPWHDAEDRKVTTFRVGKIAVCAVLVLALGIAGIFHQQVEAAIHEFTTRIAGILGVSSDLVPYTEIIGVSQTKEGITLTLEEVVLAENQLYAVFHMEWKEKGMPAPDLNIAYEPKINGVEIIPCSSCVWAPEYDEDSKNSQNILVSYVYDDDSLPYEINEIEMEARVFTAEIDLEHEINDGIPFTFQFSASKEELQKDTYSIEVDYELKASDGVSLRLHRFQFNKVFSRISASPNEEFLGKMSEMEYILLGTDSEGNTVRYEMSGGSEGNLIFESVGMPPAEDSQWVELQLYQLKVPIVWEQETVQDEESEEALETSGVYTVDDLDYVPAGEKIRIDLI